MTAKHTLGPWLYEPGETLSAVSAGKGDDYSSIAFLTLPNHAANARLIAAAPDLLEALKAMRDDTTIAAVCRSPLWAVMVNAIEKAEGADK
jgi:hypothetical protein